MLLFSTLLQAAAGLSLGKVGASLGAAIAAFAAAFGISKIGKASIEAGARQPEQAGHYRMTAIIISALIEGACLFAIVVCIIAK
ncbi:MAG: F0F1 ATP synthase subunit C [Bacteroidales bacterium]|nr:F0F1 ATP synthase subunit C [Bacteroidales bacterium]MDO4212758.1 F0F1 ATP synthase subunit C [Bacteroidales bacterium]